MYVIFLIAIVNFIARLLIGRSFVVTKLGVKANHQRAADGGKGTDSGGGATT